jgi:hypothetical protein
MADRSDAEERKALSDELRKEFQELIAKLQDEQRQTAIDILSALDQVPEFDEARFRRIVPLSVYIDGDVADRPTELLNSIEELYGSAGFETFLTFPPSRGSWWQRIFTRTKDTLRKPEVKERLDKVERAIELANIGKVQAGIDKDLAQAALNMVKSLKDYKEGVIFLGSVVVVKTTEKKKPKLAVFNLSHEQMKYVQDHPDLYLDAHRFKSVFSSIGEKVGLPAADELHDIMKGFAQSVADVAAEHKLSLPPPQSTESSTESKAQEDTEKKKRSSGSTGHNETSRPGTSGKTRSAGSET